MYIDGSATVDKTWAGRNAGEYEGQGTIYLSGTFAVKNTKLCAVVDGQQAGLQRLRRRMGPEQRGAHRRRQEQGHGGPASQATAGNNSVELKSAEFQGALAANTTSSARRPRSMQGPMSASTAAPHQPDLRRLLPRHPLSRPPGAPGNPPPPSILLEPREFEGG